MGFFAVLKDSSDNPFEVVQCHLNLWSLAGLLGRRTFFWDVGLWLKADKGTVSSFQLALPFGTERAQMKDLHDHVLNQSIAYLIFGKPVNIQASTIDWGYGPIDVTYVLKGIKEQSEKGFSLWKLSLNPPIQNGKQSYIRVRFEPRNLGRVWVWKRSGLAKTGALVDLRISDVRQAVSVPSCGALESLILPIKELFLFLIAPGSLQFRAVSPPLHYMRLLEGRVWEPYLGRAADFWRAGKLVICEWRNKDAVSPMTPFRAFVDLSREFGLMPLSNYVVSLSLVALAILIAYYFEPSVLAMSEQAMALFSKHLYQLSLATVVVLIGYLLTYLGPVKSLLNRTRESLLKLEQWIYRARM